MENERCLLSKYARQQSKYGSTSSNFTRKEKHIQHVVQPTDTLQGIALRYGVTMEDIKRVNKLWTTDSLFVRTSLLIPVPNDFVETPTSSASNTPTSSPSKGCYTDISLDLSSTDSASQLSSLTESRREKDESMADFLIRIDSSIAQTKDKVMLLDQTNTESESYPRTWRSRHHNPHSANGISRDISSDPTLTPHPVVMTQGRKVRSSLKRLEQEQDEIFEL